MARQLATPWEGAAPRVGELPENDGNDPNETMASSIILALVSGT